MEITKEQFNKLATKDDVKEIVREETKDLRENVSILKQGQRELIDRVQPLEGKITKFKDDILTGQDKIMKELKTIRVEQVAFIGGQQRQDDKLEEHDKRLEQVETKVGIEPITTYDGDG